jgi:hypothetical protein
LLPIPSFKKPIYFRFAVYGIEFLLKQLSDLIDAILELTSKQTEPNIHNRGDSNYGTAPEGSLSEERAKKAAIWVEKEVYKLLGEIEALGRTSGNEVHVTFGELFNHYQDVSDTLVSLLENFCS